MAIRASEIPWSGSEPPAETKPIDRIFRERGEGKYSLEIMPMGIALEIDRLRRERDGLIGELIVRVPKSIKGARSYNGVINYGDINLGAVRSRAERAKLVSSRAGDAEGLDWYGFLEELCVRIGDAERQGKPAIILADLDIVEDKGEAWDVHGFPILTELPMVLFGDAASGKSYFAMWIAGELARAGVNVLYVDWELTHVEHRKRLGRLFQPMPRNLHYVRCEYPLSMQTDRLTRVIQEHKAQYVICDSISFAVDGAAETGEAALKYFRALRQLRVGTLNLAHIPKQYDDSREAQMYGSVFFKAGARSAWFVDKAAINPKHEIRFGLHHRKSNVGELLPAMGCRLTFTGAISRLEFIDIKTVDELATQLPLLERVKLLLSHGPKSLKDLTEELNVPVQSVRNTFARHKSIFVKMGNKYGVIAEGVDF